MYAGVWPYTPQHQLDNTIVRMLSRIGAAESSLGHALTAVRRAMVGQVAGAYRMPPSLACIYIKMLCPQWFN